MRANIVKSVFKKEMMDILRDRKTLFMTVILPIILYPIIMFLMTFIMSSASSTMAQRELKVAFSAKPAPVLMDKIESIKEEEGRLEIVELQQESYKEALDDGDIDAYIVNKTDGNTDTYEIYYNASKDNANEVTARLEKILESYKAELITERLTELGLNEKDILQPITYKMTDVAEGEQLAGYLLGMILPFILVLGILSGAIYPAIDVMAGEKERGTLETLLTLPISNLELVMGKYLAVALSALVSATLSIISIIFSMVFLFLSIDSMAEGMIPQMDFTKLTVPFIITFICICIFTLVISAISMCVCSLAKSFKEAQNAITPLMMSAMFLSYSCMIPTLELNQVTASIPVVNIVLLIKSVLTFKYNTALLTIVLISNIIFVIVAVWILSKLFRSEEVLFGNSKGFSFLEPRSDIKKGTLPSLSDGIIVFAITMVLMIYVCSYLQARFNIGGIIATQLVIIICPLLLSIYIKTDFKKVYSLHRPKILDIVGSVFLWVGIWILITFMQGFLAQFSMFKDSQTMDIQQTLLTQYNGVVTFLAIAIMPAICEEILFRGFLFTSAQSKKGPMRAIVFSSILFGLAHMDLLKLLPIICLGFGLGYIVYKTRSIFCSMLVHCLNNAVAFLALRYYESEIGALEAKLQAGGVGIILIIIIAAMASIGLGILLFRRVDKVR